MALLVEVEVELRKDAKLFVAYDAEEDTAGAPFEDAADGGPNGNEVALENVAAGV